MHNQSHRTLQTQLAPVSRPPASCGPPASSSPAAMPSMRRSWKGRPNYLTFRGQGGEEIVLAAFAEEGATVVNGSSYMFDQQVARFPATLTPVAQVAGATP